MSSDYNYDQQYGSSLSLLDYILKYQIAEIKPKQIVDFGAGGGKNGRLIREVLGSACRIVAVEGCQSTAQMLTEKGPYDEVKHDLLQRWHTKNSQRYDLAIYGDVLEHLTPKEIKQVMESSLKYFSHIVVVAPLHDIFQEAAYGNPLEVHRSYITSGFFNRYNPIEKHVATTAGYLIMNVHILSEMRRNILPSGRLKGLFHIFMLAFQPLGLARPFVNFLKRYFIGYKYLIRDGRKL